VASNTPEYQFPAAAAGYSTYGLPGWIRQADILRPLAPILSVRDDTFTIRAYGDARDAQGRILAHVVCEAVVRRTRDFCSSDVLSRTLTPEGRMWVGPHLKAQYPWEIDGYLRQHHSIRRRVLADWVAVRAEDETRLAASLGMAKAFPLLDERLIAALLQQDPALFGEGGESEILTSARRSRRLADIVGPVRPAGRLDNGTTRLRRDPRTIAKQNGGA
jgi:hypothetical protein